MTTQFTGVANFTTQDLTIRTPKLIPFIEENPSQSLLTSYVDLADLEQALSLYYSGDLDFVPYENVNHSLDSLIPSSALLSQLEAYEMKSCLQKISFKSEVVLQVAHDSDSSSRDLTTDYVTALQELAVEVHKLLI